MTIFKTSTSALALLIDVLTTKAIKTMRYAQTTRIKRGSMVRTKRRKSFTFAAQLLLCLALITILQDCKDSFSYSEGMGVCVPKFLAEASETVDDENEYRSSTMRMKSATVPSVAKSSQTRLRGGNIGDNDVLSRQKQGATFSEILKKAGKSGIGGGVPGAIAGVCQVFSLMWLRTVMNYQCRYGASFTQTIRILYNEGGIPRFYRGLSFALVHAPLARFVSTAANDGVETLLANLKISSNWGPGKVTVIASIVVGMWRMLLMPMDTCKTVLQVDSVTGFRNLMRKVKAGQIQVLYQGAIANAVSAVAAHYPWFYTYKVLHRSRPLQKLISHVHLRNAFIGFTASVISDTFANAIRVVKTTKQSVASKHTISYGEVIAMILSADGWKGLFGRGLRTRILGNAIQSVVFTLIWRALADSGRKKAERAGNETGLSRIGNNMVDTKTDMTSDVIEDKGVPMEEERS